MLKFLVVLIFVASCASVQSIAYPGVRKFSAASPAQIRFAYENKFDETGPGAKEPENAYKTYTNLDDALLAYVNDPDTQLPPFDKARAIANLYRHHKNEIFYEKKDPQNQISNLANRPKILPILLNSYSKFDESKLLSELPHLNHDIVTALNKEAFRWNKDHTPKVKEIPSFSTEIKQFHYQYKPHPEVEFSIDVHDKETGDLKTASELRDGSGTVHGYYTVLDNDGRRRTVHYQANPSKGFKTSVQRVY